ncbi:MAG TPA: metallophosphoesterase, partial [Rectinemataceae bacterium]
MKRNTESILNPAQKRALVWALVALAVCAVMNIYHYSLQGSRGLYLWNRTWMFRALILMGLAPIGFVLISFPLDKLKSKVPASLARGLSILLSILVAAASAGILVLLVAGPRLGSLEPARLALVDPSKGLGRVDRTEPAISSGMPAQAGAHLSTGPAAQPSPATLPGTIPSPPAGLPRLRLSVSSDPHWGVETASQSARTDILASIAERKPDAFFILGDMVETGSKSAEWNSALADLEAILPKTPIRTLMGNHDALLGGQHLYKKAFFPEGMGSDSGSPYYYSIADEEGTFIFLNLPWGTENFGKAQRSWL